MNEGLRLESVDYLNELQANDLVELVNDYAKDPMGGGKELPDNVKETLAHELANVPGAFSYIAYVDNRPAGIVNCFMGFSTFQARPLVNIHDLAIRKEYRGLHISQQLLELVEEVARSRNCCKITLEVLGRNKAAQHVYENFGFFCYELDDQFGKALFWEKRL